MVIPTIQQPEFLTWFIICVIMFGGALFFIAELMSAGQFKKRLRLFKKLALHFKEATTNTIPDDLLTISRTLLVSDYNDTPLKRGDLYVLRNELVNVLPLKYSSDYRFVPALLTTTGVLGTFTGISLGLMDFNTAGASIDGITGAATGLLDGMKTAFWTSVAGMLSSLIFTFLLYRSSVSADNSWARTWTLLSNVTIYPSSTELLLNLGGDEQAKLLKLQLKSAQEAQTFQQQLADCLGDLNVNLGQLSAEHLGGVVGDVIRQSTREELAPAVQAIAKQLEELKAIKADNGEKLIEIIFNTIKDDVVTPMAKEMKAVSSNVLATTGAVTKLTESLSETSTSLKETTQVLTRFQEETMKQLQSFAGDLTEILGGFQGSVKKTLESVSAEIKNSMEVAKQGMEGQRKAFSESAAQAAQAFTDQNSQLQSVGETAKELMTSAAVNLEQGLGDLDSKIKAMSAATQQELERFRIEYQGNLKSFFEQQANLLEESLGQQRDGLSVVVDNFRNVFVDELATRVEQYTQLSAGERVLRELNEAILSTQASVVSQLSETARTMGGQVQRIEKSYQEGAARFQELGDAMPKAMKEWFQDATDTQHKFFTSFDEESAKVFGHLVNVAEILHSAGSVEIDRKQLSGVAA